MRAVIWAKRRCAMKVRRATVVTVGLTVVVVLAVEVGAVSLLAYVYGEKLRQGMAYGLYASESYEALEEGDYKAYEYWKNQKHTAFYPLEVKRDYLQGMKALNSGNEAEGYRLIGTSAAEGFPEAMYVMARAYEDKKLVSVTKDIMEKYYIKAAGKMYVPAMVPAGILLESEEGQRELTKHYGKQKAMELIIANYELAADACDGEALERVVQIHEKGEFGLAVSKQGTEKWRKKAVECRGKIKSDWVF